MEFSFTYPALLYFLLLCPISAVLCLWARRRKAVTGISLVIWKSTLEQTPANLQNNPLPLHVLAAFLFPAFIVIPASGLKIKTASGSARTVTVVDTSQSMQTVLDGSTRLNKAKEVSRNISLKNNNSAVIFTKGSNSENILKNHLDKGFSITWISDKAAPVNSPLIQSIIIGKPSRNTAILKAAKINRKLIAILANYSGTAKEITLKWQGGSTQGHKACLLPAGEKKQVSILLADHEWQKSGGMLKLSITPEDDLAHDNRLTIRFPLTASIDAIKYPHLATALHKAAGLSILPQNKMADIAVSPSPATQPRMAAIYIGSSSNPSKQMKAKFCKITDEGKKAGIPSITIYGLENFYIPEKFYQGTTLIKCTGDYELPFLTLKHNRKGHLLSFYIATLPEKWTKRTGFAVLVAWLASNCSSGIQENPEEESNNRIKSRSSKNQITENVNEDPKIIDTSLYLTAVAAFITLLLLKKELKTPK